jgi:hypothetical protein
MAKIFVSYSRSDKAKVRKLIPLLRENYGYENVWWDQNFYGGQVWWEELLKQINQCDVFVFSMSQRSLSSPYCLAELEEARRLRKPIVYVKLRGNTQVPEIIASVQYVQLVGGVSRKTIAPLVRSINEYASRPRSMQAPITPNRVALPFVPPKEPRNLFMEYTQQITIGVIVTLIGGVALSWFIQEGDRFSAPSPGQLIPAVTNTLTLSSERIALTPVARNADWTPVERDFGGVTMVLVPAGCFMMGSEDGSSNETPIILQS